MDGWLDVCLLTQFQWWWAIPVAHMARWAHSHFHLLLWTNTEQKTVFFFPQLACSSVFVVAPNIHLYLCTQCRVWGSPLVNTFDYGKSINGSEWLRCSQGAKKSPCLAGESCKYNGVNVKLGEANTHSSFINALNPEAARYEYLSCYLTPVTPDLKPLWELLPQL